MSDCAAPGCERSSHAKGYCGMHYQRLRQYGSLERTTDMTHNVVERFWRHVEQTDGCWLWTGPTFHNGYGVLHLHGKSSARTHRFAYELLVGPIPDGMTIDHVCHDERCAGGPSCPHRRCVNPEHLQLATQAENVRRSLAGRRQGLCKRGHEIDYSGGRGYCRTCRNAALRERRRANPLRRAGSPQEARDQSAPTPI